MKIGISKAYNNYVTCNEAEKETVKEILGDVVFNEWRWVRWKYQVQVSESEANKVMIALQEEGYKLVQLSLTREPAAIIVLQKGDTQ